MLPEISDEEFEAIFGDKDKELKELWEVPKGKGAYYKRIQENMLVARRAKSAKKATG